MPGLPELTELAAALVDYLERLEDERRRQARGRRRTQIARDRR